MPFVLPGTQNRPGVGSSKPATWEWPCDAFQEGGRELATWLKVAMIERILTLYEMGWSQRRTAREVGVSRDAVAKYVRENRPGVPAGSPGSAGSQRGPGVPAGSGASLAGQSRPGVPAGFERSQSR